jgi:hypothetical protein
MNHARAMSAVCFCAGLLGGLVNSLLVWWCGVWGITPAAGVNLAPDLSAAWLYPRLVWGGLWGLAYYLTVSHQRNHRRWVRKGLLISFLPTAFQLFFVFPQQTPHGLMGMGLGTLTPLFVIFFNLAWGFCTGLFTRLIWGRA